ncbi:MAG TPA: hypothetical protein VFK47_15515 [Ktedonobacteraceae bacterium]|nr:hypothetical protein [Ktedonobacteraceae bacterium]
MVAVSVDSEVQSLTDEDINRALNGAATKVRSRFYGYVELDDLKQQGRLARLEHPIKFRRLAESGNYLGTWQEFNRVMSAYANKERAAKTGYKAEDLFFYNKRLLRELIPAILNSWQTGNEFEHEYHDRSAWMDVESGLQALTASDYQIICWAFLDDPGEEAGYANVGAHLGITSDAARQRVNRILDHIRETLGGPNPFTRRRAVSNAAAMAKTRNQWDGEG